MSNTFPKLRLSVAKKAIIDFKKIASANHNIANIKLFYVESEIDCTLTHGDIDEDFYCSMENMFEKTLKLIVKEDMFHQFQLRLQFCLRNTYDLGWGFHDMLVELYNSYLNEIEQ